MNPLKELRLKNRKKSLYECRAKGCGWAYIYKKWAEACHGDKAWKIVVSKEEYEQMVKNIDSHPKCSYCGKLYFIYGKNCAYCGQVQ